MATPKSGRHFAPSMAGDATQVSTPAGDETVAWQGDAVEQSGAAAPAPAPTPASQAPAGRPGPVNPLVAAREAGAGRAQGSASDARPMPTSALYDMSAAQQMQAVDGQGRPLKSFDTSFNERRSLRRTLLIVLIVIAALAALVVGGFLFLRQQARTQATEAITAAIQRISDADVVVAPLDEAIGSEISSSTVSQALTDAMLSSTTASNALTDAAKKADEADSKRVLLTAEQTEVIDAIKGSVAARRSMLEIGRTLLASDTEVAKALESLDAAYASISAVNDKVRQSQDSYNAYSDAAGRGDDLSGFDLWATVDIDNQAVTDITNAQASVAAAKEAFPDADYTALENYLSTRLAELQVIVAFDTAVANDDQDGANAMVDQLNQAADASAQAATSVPGTSRDLVRDAYAVVTSGQSEQYDAARSQCVENDAVIRAFLGTDDADGTAPLLAASSEGDAAAGASSGALESGAPAAADPASGEVAPAETGVAGDGVSATSGQVGEPAAEPAPDAENAA